MAAPTQATQELPSWFSATTITLPQTTETSLMYLPLTYYGPSIPLGTEWTYGGLTSPASSSSVESTSTSAPSTTASTTASSILSSSATPSATPSIPSSSVSQTSSAAPSSSSAASISPIASSASRLSRGQLIGIIIGSVLGTLVLFLLCMSCGMRFCGRRQDDGSQPVSRRSKTVFTALIPRRRRRTRTRFTMVTPATGAGSTDEFDADWLVVQGPDSPVTPTEPGRGRTEADPFLTPAPGAAPPPGRPSSGSGSNGNSNSASSRGTGATTSSGTNVSGYGVLLAHPSLGIPPEASTGSPFDLYGNRNLPSGAAPPHPDAPIIPGRRILSPAQLAMLVEEDEVLPRPSMEGSHMSADREEGEVVVARRVTVSASGSSAALAAVAGPSNKDKHRSWIPRFSWLSRESRSSRNSRDIEEEGGLLLFDARRHSPANSVSGSAPGSPPLPPRSPLRASRGSESMPTSPLPALPPNEMREFGERARPLLPFLAAGSRPISGASVATTGSAQSGATVYEDARETLSTRGSSSRVGNGNGNGNTTPAGNDEPAADPLDMPAPAAFTPFVASTSQASSRHSLRPVASEHSLHDSTSASATASVSQSHSQYTSTTPSAATLATSSGASPLKPERAYAFGPPGLGFDYIHNYSLPMPREGQQLQSQLPDHTAFRTGSVTSGGGASIGSWDAAGLELGFARPASHSKLGTFGSGNRQLPVPPSPSMPMPAPVPVLFGSAAAPGIRIVGGSPLAGAARDAHSSAPHLSLDLDDAPPGADGGWRLLGGHGHSLLGSGSESVAGVAVRGGDVAEPGKRGTFGVSPAAQYHQASGPPSEHSSLHSRLNQSINSGSLSSRSNHSQMASGATGGSSGGSHSLYPSSGSGSGSGSAGARARTLQHAGSVEGPMSPAISAFGHHLAEPSGSSGSVSRKEASGSSGSHAHGSPLARSRSPASPLMSPWAGGLDPDWRPTYA